MTGNKAGHATMVCILNRPSFVFLDSFPFVTPLRTQTGTQISETHICQPNTEIGRSCR